MSKSTLSCLIIGLALTVHGWEASAGSDDLQLIGWGGGKPEDIVPQAADVGFDTIIVWNNDAEYLGRLVTLGKQHGIEVYSSLSLSHADRWKKRFPTRSAPLQVMDERENAALEQIKADKTKGKSNYQYGGEPYDDCEVLMADLLCLHHPDVVDYCKKEIEDILGVAGIAGVAFDYFGYRNYRCCLCEHSEKLFEQFQRERPDQPEQEALVQFSLTTLVGFNNELADHARAVKPGAKVMSHVYPVFLAEPLYGNRLKVDVCGQTAAWFFEPFWSYDKIRQYSQVIFGQEKKCFDLCEGAALIGIYERPDRFPVKSSERITKELQTILDAGGDRVQVCSMNNVLASERISAIFRQFFGR